MNLNKKIAGGGPYHFSTLRVWIVLKFSIFKNYSMLKTVLIAITTNYIEGVLKIILKYSLPIVIRSVINKEVKSRLQICI